MDTIIEKKEPPSWVVDRITKLGGLNTYGRPIYRVIWGGNRYHLVGGMFKKPITIKDEMIIGKSVTIVTEVAEMRNLLKYNPFRWHLERWIPPEAYGSREDWYRDSWDEASQLHMMGDYPSEGDYEHVFFLAECPHMGPDDRDWCMLCRVTSGVFIPLEENVHMLEMQITALRMSQGVSKSQERTALFLREDQKRQIRNKEVGDRVRGAMRPKIATQPTSWQTGDRCSVPEAKLDIMAPSRPGGFRQSDELITKQEEMNDAN